MNGASLWKTLAAAAAGVTAVAGVLKGAATLFKRAWSHHAARRDKPILEAIAAISEKVDENERGRLRQEIFRYGNFARRGMPVSGEEFRYLQSCFEKYAALGGNGIAHEEYHFVRDYYNQGGNKA